jgi:hypothetical protein
LPGEHFIHGEESLVLLQFWSQVAQVLQRQRRFLSTGRQYPVPVGVANATGSVAQRRPAAIAQVI